MITEDYVSFETAKLLKEKGFDEVCYRIYDTKEKELFGTDGIEFQNHEADQETITAPTLQMAMKWLREVHNITIDTEWEHAWYAYVKPMTANPSEDDYYQCVSIKYEEVIETAIKYCLENLI